MTEYKYTTRIGRYLPLTTQCTNMCILFNSKDSKMSQTHCRYCIQELCVERDPRKLECGHAFCLQCLLGEQASSSCTEYQCPVCRLVVLLVI